MREPLLRALGGRGPSGAPPVCNCPSGEGCVGPRQHAHQNPCPLLFHTPDHQDAGAKQQRLREVETELGGGARCHPVWAQCPLGWVRAGSGREEGQGTDRNQGHNFLRGEVFCLALWGSWKLRLLSRSLQRYGCQIGHILVNFLFDLQLLNMVCGPPFTFLHRPLGQWTLSREWRSAREWE